MHGYDAKDLGHAMRTVRKNTIQIAEEIPEDKYGFRPAEGCRSVAETLAHIALSPRWQHKVHSSGLTEMTFELFSTHFGQSMKDEAELKTKPKAEILAALQKNGDEVATWMETLSGDVLAQQVTFPPATGQPPKTRFEMLLSMKEHEMHHRAQLMVVERMLGIVPHLTRQMQERMAATQKQQSAGATSA